ncbi:electron transport complex subunit RsxG [Halochromatium salexigens]|uniref:Ion-translocating oxidoreductase complex subunit G n=1 Tax=Halochromatium salexigens TaxID=49447 RepID=A0AAJ0UI77_HALSE|nr:electron transport complex subunit RsxG [Halochromatium salexigens]MBK5931220.1 electron transport complex subunit RsxG [Halochromatium salexigens]
MKKAPILIAAFILGSFAVGGVGLVAVTHELTDARIAENQREAMLAKLKAIVPAGRMSNDPLADRIEVSAPELLGGQVTEVYRVRDGDEPVAVILKPIVPDGYAGPIKLLVSVLRDGSLGGVRVIEHHETPGLGDKIEERKDDWIVEQFEGRSLGEPPLEDWTVKRDGGVFDQFTGATITPRSVVNAVKGTLLFVQRHGESLYAQPAEGTTDEAAEPMQAAAASQQAKQVAPSPASAAAAKEAS